MTLLSSVSLCSSSTTGCEAVIVVPGHLFLPNLSYNPLYCEEKSISIVVPLKGGSSSFRIADWMDGGIEVAKGGGDVAVP